MMSETSQRKTNAVWFQLYVESKNKTKQTKLNQNRLMEKEPRGMVTRGRGGGWVTGGGGTTVNNTAISLHRDRR